LDYLTPAVICSVFFLCIGLGRKIREWLKYQNQAAQTVLLSIIDGLKVQVGDWKKTILLPALLTVAFAAFLSWALHPAIQPNADPLWLAAASAGFLGPVSDEFIFRGIGLGLVVALIAALRSVKLPQFVSDNLILSMGAIFWSFLFVFSRDTATPYQFISRFCLSTIISCLYILNDRNMLPAIVAHSTYNLMLVASAALSA
jgi:hypothetical protein